MRPLRVLYPGAVYHVTARGNERRVVFQDATDYRRFLQQLELVVSRYCWTCHGYCLMGNHYHLLVETPRANLPIGMRHLNGCHGQWLNRRWQRLGHVFQGRYKAEVVEKQPYLLELIRYLALNPIRTTPPLSENPEGYPWSSYRVLLGLEPRPPWLTIDWTLTWFGDEYESARARLRAFVAEDLGADSPRPVGGLYHGSEQFISRTAPDTGPIPEVPRAHWQPLRPPLSEVFATTDGSITAAYQVYGYTMKEIAQHLGCHYQTVSRHLRHTEQLRDSET